MAAARHLVAVEQHLVEAVPVVANKDGAVKHGRRNVQQLAQKQLGLGRVCGCVVNATWVCGVRIWYDVSV